MACRQVQHGQPAFHRSVSQPVDMDLTGLSSFPGGAGWKAGEGSAGNASAVWGASNVAPSTGQSTVVIVNLSAYYLRLCGVFVALFCIS